jgi:hypothetical protein
MAVVEGRTLVVLAYIVAVPGDHPIASLAVAEEPL